MRTRLMRLASLPLLALLVLLPLATPSVAGLTIAIDPLPSGMEGIPYHAEQKATNGVPPYAWSVMPSVMAWGNGFYGQTTVPTGLDDAIALAGGGFDSFALKSNGTVVAWGFHYQGQTSVLTGLVDVVAIAAGWAHGLALKSNGTVVAWGDNGSDRATVPSGLSNVTAIAAGLSHSLAVKSDGTVVAWGDNGYGQSTVPSGLSNVVAMAGGRRHSLALKGDGTVEAWGDNGYGQTNVPPGLANVVAISSGMDHNLALKSDGTVVGWGYNGSGQASASGLSNVMAIACGGDHSLALKANGAMVAWGGNWNGQAIVPAGLSNVVAIAGGGEHSLALRSKASQLPEGLVCSTGGVVSGTPLLSGARVVTFEARDSAGAATNKAFEIVIAPNPNTRPVISSNSPASFVCSLMEGGDSRSFQLWASDPEGSNLTYSWTWDGACMRGNSNVYVHTTSWGGIGPHLLRGYVSDGCWTNAVYVQWNVSVDDVPIDITTPSLPSCMEMEPYGASLEATNGFVPYTWTATALPEGLSCSTGGLVKGTPTVAGTSVVTIVVRDRDGASTNKALEIVITPNANLRPAVSSNFPAVGSFSVNEATSQLFQVWASDPEDRPLTYAWSWDGYTVGSGDNAYTLVTEWGDSGVHTLRCSVSDELWTNVVFVQWNVSMADVPIEIVTPFLPSGMEKDPYRAELEAAYGVAPYMWTVAPPVEAWGNNGNGQATVPPDLSDVVAVAGGEAHSLALKADGSVRAWGANNYGQENVPPGLVGVTAIAAGYTYNLALKSNGTVVAWGDNYDGQTNVPPGLSNVTEIAAGRRHSLVLKTDGTVVVWGDSNYGQTSVPAGLSNVKAIAVGADNCMALKANGTVVEWGYGSWLAPTNLSGIVGIAGGRYHNMALLSNGTVVSWGGVSVPPDLSNVVSIAAGWGYGLALKADGCVVAWGDNSYGQTNVPPGLSNVIGIAGGVYHGVALFAKPPFLDLPDGLSCSAGGVVTGTPKLAGTYAVTFMVRDSAGAVTNKILDLTVAANLNTRPVIDSTIPLTGAFSMVEATSQLFRITAHDPEGKSLSYFWKMDGAIVGDESSSNVLVTTLSDLGRHALRCYVSDDLWTNVVFAQWDVNVVDLPIEITTASLPPGRTGKRYGIRLEAAFGAPPYTWSVMPVLPSLAAWGDPNYGQTNIPAGLEDVSAIARGQFHSLARKTDGALVAWGNNSSGETTVPGGLSGLQAMAGGGKHSLALRLSQVTAWGNNQYGQATVPQGLVATRISAGLSHSLAVKSGGAVVAWGNNQFGQTNVPAGLAGVVAVAAGSVHSMALKNNGTVVAFGDNSFSQSTVPPGLSGVTAIAAGGFHSLARKSDGTVIAWGRNNYGQTDIPPGLTGVVAVAAGLNHNLALKTDGTVVAWGFNSQEQTSVPAGLSNVLAIAAGGNGSLALRRKATNVPLPEGLTCSGDGTISGTPVQAGTGLITVVVRDALGATASRSFDLPVCLSANPLGSIIYIRADVNQ